MVNLKKILITGASGFIGRSLCQYFHTTNNEVIACTSKNQTNTDIKANKLYAYDFPNNEFHKLLQIEKPNYVLHCSGSSSVGQSFEDPDNDFEKNVVVTHFILSSLRKYSPESKLVYFSSAAVYGNPQQQPITSDTLLKPISPYGYHKLLCEKICEEYYKLYNLPITILRIFSVFGPGLKKQILWDIYQKALNSKQVLLQGTGKESRDFIFIEDLINVIANVMEKSSFENTILNIGTGSSITIENLATKFLKQIDRENKLNFTGEYRVGDPVSWSLHLDDLMQQCAPNWISMEMGLKKYLDWVRQQGV